MTPYQRNVAIVFVAGLFMDILDLTIVNVALPDMARELGGSIDSIEWVVLGYLLSLAVFIPASGWLGDRYGTKRIFLLALALFTAGSALCAFANTIPQLVAYRVLQGVGGGMLTPVGTTMLFRAFPPDQRARASTILFIPATLAPASGPVIGGFITTKLSWPWIFLINIPLGIAAFIFGAIKLKEHREPSTGPFDVAGFVLSGLGLTGVLYALSQGPRNGWGATDVVGAGAVGIISFVLLAIVELRIPHPMLALRLLGSRLFLTSNLVSFFSYGSFISLVFLMPLYLQTLRGLSPLQSGLATFPQAVGVLISSQFVGRKLYPIIGPRRLMLFGLVAAAVVVVTYTPLITLDSTLWHVRGIMFVRGIMMAFAFIPLQTMSYAQIAPADTGRASAIYQTQRQTGAAFGVAIVATVLASRTAHRLGNGELPDVGRLNAFHDAFYVVAAMAVVAAVIAVFVHDSDAEATMRR
jgi:EmrB/QacA subfamily drug resistance transporter